MAIDLQPATNPLDIPAPRLSSIVRNWPDAMWESGAMKKHHPDGHITFCAIGILYETSGGEWGEPDWPDQEGTNRWHLPDWVVTDHLGLKIGDLISVVHANDRHGKDAAADVLESLGL